MKRIHDSLASFVLLIGVAAGMALSGCTAHSVYEPEDRVSIDDLPDPNQPNIERVVTASLRYVLDRYRAGGTNSTLAINLPPGTRKSNYERIAGRVGENVVPLTTDIGTQRSIPIYHVGRVRLRGNSAKVDIFRPTLELAPDPKTGKPVYQMITVTLEGGLQPWRAVHARPYEPGAFPIPQLYAVPPLEDPFQFENWKRTQHEIALAKERADLDRRIEAMPAPEANAPLAAPVTPEK